MTDPSPLAGIDLVLADLDGVVYRGPAALPHAIESLNRIGESAKVAYITNNASRTDVSVAGHLTELGLTVAPDDVVTSPQAAVNILKQTVDAGSTILVVGGDGLVDEVSKAGFVVTRSALDAPAAVIQGFSPEVGWTHLAEAAFALNGDGTTGDLPWIATNTDWTIPQARGTAPGNGTLVSAVHTAVGRLPVVAGKPEVAIFTEALVRYGSQAPLMIGDRLDTDILGANRAGIPSVLVLTGIDGPKQVLAAVEAERPTFVIDDLRGLHEPYPATQTREIDGGTLTIVGTAAVRLVGNVLTVDAGEGIDLLRAGAAAIWNSGLAIYALDVPPELYS
ncbi:HAD-IIA family hydrolase [Salinibacterium sp. G-O1]|uniref:HAD-IIA family hydrolase n=1 Tax=Salinibacterium sp. G-O1 TaxID=3046208 RepID=UPI0024BBC0F2|nr:HAD-IIA family hydrolase [Salinibacterium sp. G-O1]MDJ0334849.1 HAD-IIA family hydrolase [Salinibacterium sp. G-O1]